MNRLFGPERLSDRAFGKNKPAFVLKPRTGFRIVAGVAYFWCAVCVFCLVFGIVTRDRGLIGMGAGEGLCVLIIGFMLSTLARSVRESRYVAPFGKRFKKIPFIAVCIAVSGILLFLSEKLFPLY